MLHAVRQRVPAVLAAGARAPFAGAGSAKAGREPIAASDAVRAAGEPALSPSTLHDGGPATTGLSTAAARRRRKLGG